MSLYIILEKKSQRKRVEQRSQATRKHEKSENNETKEWKKLYRVRFVSLT
jgi:hypothetical protein